MVVQLVPLVPSMNSSLATPNRSVTDTASTALATAEQQMVVATPQDLQLSNCSGKFPGS